MLRYHSGRDVPCMLLLPCTCKSNLRQQVGVGKGQMPEARLRHLHPCKEPGRGPRRESKQLTELHCCCKRDEVKRCGSQARDQTRHRRHTVRHYVWVICGKLFWNCKTARARHLPSKSGIVKAGAVRIHHPLLGAEVAASLEGIDVLSFHSPYRQVAGATLCKVDRNECALVLRMVFGCKGTCCNVLSWKKKE